MKTDVGGRVELGVKVKVLERLVDEEEDESGEAEGIVSILDPSPASPPALPPPALLPPAFAAVPSINSPKPTIVTIISTSVLLGVFPVLVLLLDFPSSLTPGRGMGVRMEG